jgi:hypothetical protein
MLTNIESELERIIAMAEENQKISSEYKYKFYRIFLTLSESREILKIIKNGKDCHMLQSEVADWSSASSLS